MPTYEFACIACDIQIEQYFTFHEDHRVECKKCGNAMIKVMQATPAQFKGGGWGGK
jgi:putative FmdB family regulatory protein